MMKPELVAPAGNWEGLRAAVESGADAVYLGLKEFNMRASANNFELSEIPKVVDYCHSKNVKVYVTLNTIIYDDELTRIENILKKLKLFEIDSIVAWDISVVKKALSIGLNVHLSTQAGVSNSESAKFFKDMGISRIVLARECSLKRIRDIIEKSGIKVECFIHGAMCVSISGRCYTSQFIFGKSANRGECIQPCRRTYSVKDKESGFELDLDNDRVMSPKDLCALPFLDKLVEAGISAFKIEGRVRPPEYVKTVVSVYRRAIDYIASGTFDSVRDELMSELKTVYNKKFSTGFFIGTPTNDDWTDVSFSDSPEEKMYIGSVLGYFKKIGVAKAILYKGNLKKGDKIMIIGKNTGIFSQTVSEIQMKNSDIDVAERGSVLGLKVDRPVHRGDKIFVLSKRLK